MKLHSINLAIIGGTGVYQLAQLEAIEDHTIQTEFRKKNIQFKPLQ